MHWTKRNEQKKFIESLTIAALMKENIKRKITEGRLQITYNWNNGLDLDNNAWVKKAITDAISRYLLGGRDDTAYVGRFIDQQWMGDGVLVEVEERTDLPKGYIKEKEPEYPRIPRVKKKRAG